jgi:hypothetical protein
MYQLPFKFRRKLSGAFQIKARSLDTFEGGMVANTHLDL